MAEFKNYLESVIYPSYSYATLYSDDDHSYVCNDHDYTIPLDERRDLTHITCYSVDPDRCKDVDDAFSIWRNQDGVYTLAIHIADPTHFFSLHSNVHSSIQKNCFTHYPSNREPLHMMPKRILQEANLMVHDDVGDDEVCIKPAMSVLYTLDKESYLPVDYEIVGSLISLQRSNKLSYNVDFDEVLSDCDLIEERNETLRMGVRISTALRKSRNCCTDSLKELNRTYIMYDELDGTPTFHNASDSSMILKQMIEEFAILANGTIGAFLFVHDPLAGFYRGCVVDEERSKALSQCTSSADALQMIIQDQIRADYTTKGDKHSLVGKDHYTHFTSPLRRYSDCVVHFMVKSILLNKPAPFNVDRLRFLSSYSNKYSKLERNIQFSDKKIVTLWALHSLLNTCMSENKSVYIRIQFNSYVKQFLNFMITGVVVKNNAGTIIDSYNVHVSYTYRVFNYKHLNSWTLHKKRMIQLHEVHCITKFDVGILPDVERTIVNPDCVDDISNSLHVCRI